MAVAAAVDAVVWLWRGRGVAVVWPWVCSHELAPGWRVLRTMGCPSARAHQALGLGAAAVVVESADVQVGVVACVLAVIAVLLVSQRSRLLCVQS